MYTEKQNKFHYKMLLAAIEHFQYTLSIIDLTISRKCLKIQPKYIAAEMLGFALEWIRKSVLLDSKHREAHALLGNNL